MLASAAWIAQAPAQGAQPRASDGARTPVAGSGERRLILDALRRQLRSKPTFKVAFVAIAGSHAFVRAGEVVRDGDALQETDLFIEALLLRRTHGGRSRWQVLEFWNGPWQGALPRLIEYAKY